MSKLYALLQKIRDQANKEDSCIDWATPGGFATAQVNPEVVSEFVSVFFSRDTDILAWPVKRCALEAALCLFGKTSLTLWLRETIKQSSYGYRQDEFIEDTLRFIYTGQRRLSVQSWKPLLSSEGSADVQYRVKRETFPFSTNMNMSECLSRWCAHPKGLQDMVCALDILFGDYPGNRVSEKYEPEFRVKL